MVAKRRVSKRTSRRASVKRTSPSKIVVGNPVLFETQRSRKVVKATPVLFMSPVKRRVSKRRTPRRK